MSNLVRRGLVAVPIVVPIVVALLAGALPAHAVARAERPDGPSQDCPTFGSKQPASLTLVSSTSAKETSNGYTSRAKAWVYAESDDPNRLCLVLKVTGPKVRARKGDTVTRLLNYDATIDGTDVLESGEVFPVNDSGVGGAHLNATSVSSSTVLDAVETDLVPGDWPRHLPASLAMYAGREVTRTTSGFAFQVTTSAWTTRQLATPVSKSQREKELAGELTVAKERYDARMAGATAVRDEQLALAAAATGVTATWVSLMARRGLAQSAGTFSRLQKAERKLAHHHAAEARKGFHTREVFEDEFSLELPVS